MPLPCKLTHPQTPTHTVQFLDSNNELCKAAEIYIWKKKKVRGAFKNEQKKIKFPPTLALNDVCVTVIA